jgi:hypothetical protein
VEKERTVIKMTANNNTVSLNFIPENICENPMVKQASRKFIDRLINSHMISINDNRAA